jgi:hypothetical protein
MNVGLVDRYHLAEEAVTAIFGLERLHMMVGTVLEMLGTTTQLFARGSVTCTRRKGSKSYTGVSLRQFPLVLSDRCRDISTRITAVLLLHRLQTFLQNPSASS